MITFKNSPNLTVWIKYKLLSLTSEAKCVFQRKTKTKFSNSIFSAIQERPN